VTAAGFKKVRRAALRSALVPGWPSHRLEVGELTETISVEAGCTRGRNGKGDLSICSVNKQVTDLAVNGRTFTLLQQLTRAPSRRPATRAALFQQQQRICHQRSAHDYSGIQLDGRGNTDMGTVGLFVSPGMETLAEVKIQSSNYSAEYGTAGGANVLAVTRSGTQTFMVQRMSSCATTRLTPRNFFAVSKPTLRYNNFGYRIGGPVTIPASTTRSATKTFFFFAQEWRRRRTQQIIRAATPTPASVPATSQRGGSHWTALLDPATSFPSRTTDSHRRLQPKRPVAASAMCFRSRIAQGS